MFSQLDKDIIIRLQGELPLVSQPYKAIAEELGLSETELLNRIIELRSAGVLRRLGALLHHRKAGYSANAMVVWRIPEEKAEEIGIAMSSITSVSHCYQRATSTNWNYNMFTMVHARSEQQCEKIIAKIADTIQIYEYEMLYSIKEFKKSSMQYFIEESRI